MTKRTRMEATADLLERGYDPEDVTLLAIVHAEMIELVNTSVDFHLIADNVDRPNAEKFGTHPDGSPCYAPEWYMAQAIKTAIHEGLYGTLADVMSCESKCPEHGHVCIGSVGHYVGPTGGALSAGHWDGNGCNWPRVGS